jgi:hypothetical protein
LPSDTEVSHMKMPIAVVALIFLIVGAVLFSMLRSGKELEGLNEHPVKK